MGPLRILRFGLRGGGAADDGVEAAVAPPFDEAFLETLELFDDGRTAPFADPPPPPPPERLNITDLSVLFVPPQAVALVWPRFFVKRGFVRWKYTKHQATGNLRPLFRYLRAVSSADSE